MSLSENFIANGIMPTTSMVSTISHGDMVFVDTNVQAYIGDGMYVFSMNYKLFIKRFQKLIRIDYKIVSDNKVNEPEKTTGENANKLLFIGKFIRRWRIKSIEL